MTTAITTSHTAADRVRRPRGAKGALTLGLLLVLGTAAGCTAAGPDPATPGHSSPGAAVNAAGTEPASAAYPWPAPSASAFPTGSAAAMQKEMDRWVEIGLLPGVTAAVATPQGVWIGAAGVDGAGAPLAPASGMALGGISVTFTAAQIMLLAEQGKVDLDAPASRYLPVPQVANRVTVRQLLAQRAAIPDPGSQPYSSAFTHLDLHWSPQDFLAPVARATEPPGRRFYYDNTNYVLLGLIVDAVRGGDTATAFAKDLWEPLGLSRLAYQDEQQLAPPRARPGADVLLPDGVPDQPYLPARSIASALGAAGGVAGDAESTARWGYDLYGARLLRPESVAQMTDFGDGDGYGLGTLDFTGPRFSRSDIPGVGHDGDMPGYRSVLAVIPSRQASIAILTPSTVDVVPYVKWLVKAGSLMGTETGATH